MEGDRAEALPQRLHAEGPRSRASRQGRRDGGYEPDADLRDFENVPLKDDIDVYFEREVRPHVPDAWMDRSKDKVGYERAPRYGTRSLRISKTQLTYINIVV